MPREYSTNTLLRDLAMLGLRKGDTVAVHSSLHAVGWVREGPDGLIDALIETIGSFGNLVLPGFCWNYSGVYNHYSTPVEMGAVPERARRRQEFSRSFHPTHSVIVSGPDTESFLARHPDGKALCSGGPWHLVAEFGGKVLLVGCDHRSNSMVHVGEDVSSLIEYRARSKKTWREAIGPDGRKVKVDMSRAPMCSIGFNAIELPLRRRGAIRDGYIGRAQSQLIDAPAIIEETVGLLREDPAALCCNRDWCRSCRMQKAAAAKIARE